MEKFKIVVDIEANSMKEAQIIADAMNVLYKKTREQVKLGGFLKLVQKIQTDPSKIKTAYTFLKLS